MAKKNLTEEIQELIQQIETNYQKGVDYEYLTWNEIHERGVGHINILSPRLQQYCRERFSFPLGVNDYLNFYKRDKERGYIFYRTQKTNKYEYFKWYDSQKAGHERGEPEKNPKKCSVCQKKVLKKDGRMKLWNGEVRDIGYSKVWKPSPLAYFHPECSEKYFVNKEQPNENNTQIKEKILRNLDKICLDPMGDLANAELLKRQDIESLHYLKGVYGSNTLEWKEREAKIHKVEIEGEEIDLGQHFHIASDGYQEIKDALLKGIKQNPLEWKIIEGGEKAMGKNNLILQHSSGRRHWKIGISHFYQGNSERGKGCWAEIEALINGSKFPANIELENLKNIFQKHNIRKITFENGKLTIEYDNKVNSVAKVNNQEFQELEKYCQEHNEKIITQQKLGIGVDNSTNNSQPNQNNHQLTIGLALGAGAIILVGIIYLFISRKRKNK